ncbi:unnamed protein product [Anisakis simplex]|uniref:UCR_hinge domain-containing protein n=1 Tax=Anisakis simplex TaxID=6269 RepID=A0A158PMV2_ANISI|nr:unnamed protein product [Anisakis simplex]
MRSVLVFSLLSLSLTTLTSSAKHLLQDDEPWELDAPCEPYIEEFGSRASEMINCASKNSLPPKTSVKSLDNTPCSTVIFSNYLVSYISEISNAITRKIWDQSRCSSCMDIEWKLEQNETGYRYTKNVFDFENKLYAWRDCVQNLSGGGDEDLTSANYSIICENCIQQFNSLFHFYWDVYVKRDTDFCVDVETTVCFHSYSLHSLFTKRECPLGGDGFINEFQLNEIIQMNDTMDVWHNVWKCVDNTGKDRSHDLTFIIFSFVILTTLTFLFYLASYVQSERINRTLVQYSHLEVPRGIRSRILSSSAITDQSNQQQANGEEGVDQLTFYREKCEEHVSKFKELLDECNARVNSRSKTEETCHEEMVDYIHHLDDCAMPKAFATLK